MKYIFLLFFALVIAATARAGQPWIFGSGEAVNLTNGTAFQNGVKNIAGALDPSAVAVNAPSGSMYFSTSGTIYVKQDAGLTTNWLPLGIATTGSLTTINGQSGPNVNIATGSSGSDFNIAASSNTITLNIPSASGSNRGLLTSADYAAFLAKQDAITGAASTVVSSNLTANRAVISNGSGKIAASAVTDTELGFVGGVTSAIQTQIDGKEPTIASGTTSQFWRGDKSFVALTKGDVGLGNVDNTSDANKPVSTATQTALDLKVDGAASSVDSEVMLYSGTTGKASKRATGTGYAKLTSGVLSTSATVATSDLSGQVALANGGTNKNMTAVNGGVVYTDADSQEVTSAGISGQVLKSNGAAAPTWETKNLPMKGNASLVQNVQRLIVPNKQLTLVTGSDYFAETGNKNILEDASFEGVNAAPSWTLTLGTFVADNTPIDGAFNALLTLSGQSLAFSQDSTLYQAQFADGVQGLAMARVRTSVTSTPIYVCYRQGGNTGSLTSGCVQVQANGKWGLYKVPFILGATSNGIIVTSNGVAITGDVEVDDAFVGAVDLKQDVDQSRIAGESYFAGTTNCSGWTRTSTTLGAVASDADCPGPTITENSMGSWQTTDSNLPRQTVNNLPAGKYKAKFIFEYSLSVSTYTAWSVYDGSGLCSSPVVGASDNSQTNFTVVECIFNYSSSGDRSFELYGASNSGTITINNLRTSPSTGMKFILEYFGSGSVYSASNADTGFSACNFSSLSWQGFGTVTSNLKCKRDGESLVIFGTFTTGTTTASTAQLPMPLWNGSQLTTANSSKIATLSSVGTFLRGASSTGHGGHVLANTSLQYLTFSSANTYSNATIVPLNSENGSGVAGASELVSVNISVPINGWENSNVIIGTFNEVMTTPGITKPKTCYYAFGGASATLASPTNCTTGTCVEIIDTCGAGSPPTFSSTGVYINTTFANGTFANSSFVQCTCSSFDTGGNAKSCLLYPDTGDQTISSTSSGGLVLNLLNVGTTGTAGNAYVTVKCEGQAP